MYLLVEFDIDADIIDVLYSVIENREVTGRRFLKWLYNKGNKHKYWTKAGDTMGVIFRSDAFVEWLNKNVLRDCTEKAVIIQQYVSRENEKNLPSVFF